MPTRTDRLTLLDRNITRVQSRLAALTRRNDRLSTVRLLVVLTGAVLTLLLWNNFRPVALSLALLTAIAFTGLVILHRRLRSRLRSAQDWLHIHRTHVARATLDWSHIPAPPRRDSQADHPFELDLDITGSQSLLHLLDTTATHQGHDLLRHWLLNPLLAADAITARQAQVRELSARFSTALARSSRGASVGDSRLDTEPSLQWLTADAGPQVPARLLIVLAGLCLLTAALFIINQVAQIGPFWAISFVIYVAISLTQLPAAASFRILAFGLRDVFQSLDSVFRFLERVDTAGKPTLTARLQPFKGTDRPSRQLRSLNLTLAAGSLQGNVILWATLNALVPWDLFFAYRLGQQRSTLRGLLPQWLTIWHELEALAALKTFGWLNPEYAQPRTSPPSSMAVASLPGEAGTSPPSPLSVPVASLPGEGESIVEGRQIGHPLIAHESRVCNDFQLQSNTVVLLTGSNMSGKSSFLRTLGINRVLAQVGSVTCAESLSLEPTRLFSVIRVSDSLAAGYSYFYAEVLRLKALLDALKADDPTPLFYLIDEIFKGTNNRERLLGSQAYLTALMAGRGSGLVSTHDLELATVPGLLNYHFADQVADGELRFDYRLREGVSPSTNALRIMALAGLPVDSR
jgi:ABC-type multidrug transport system fused ATPase/permease subunit